VKQYLLTGEGAFTCATAFSPDGKLIAFADVEDVWIHDAQTGKRLTGKPCRHLSQVAVVGIAFRPGHPWQFAAACQGDGVYLWDGAAQKVLHSFEGPKLVYAVAFSPDGGLLAAAAEDGGVYVWEAGDPKKAPRRLKGHAARAWCVAFSGDGKLIAAGGDDQSVRVWAADTGALLHTLWGHKGSVFGVAFDADGFLGSAGDIDLQRGEGGGEVFIWDLRRANPGRAGGDSPR
jgi:WD40 repeat protein